MIPNYCNLAHNSRHILDSAASRSTFPLNVRSPLRKRVQVENHRCRQTIRVGEQQANEQIQYAGSCKQLDKQQALEYARQPEKARFTVKESTDRK